MWNPFSKKGHKNPQNQSPSCGVLTVEPVPSPLNLPLGDPTGLFIPASLGPINTQALREQGYTVTETPEGLEITL